MEADKRHHPLRKICGARAERGRAVQSHSCASKSTNLRKKSFDWIFSPPSLRLVWQSTLQGSSACNKGLATQVSEKPHFFFKGVDSRQKAAMLDANPELQKATLPKAKPWTTEGHLGRGSPWTTEGHLGRGSPWTTEGHLTDWQEGSQKTPLFFQGSCSTTSLKKVGSDHMCNSMRLKSWA